MTVFDGDDELVISNGTLGLGNELTIGAWVNLDAGQQDNIVLSLADQFYIELDRQGVSTNFGVGVIGFGIGTTTVGVDKVLVAGDGWP